jgi:heme exporter protein CcmD
MSYVIAGYVICLSVLAAYAAWLVARRRRLTRAVALLEDRGPEGVVGAPTAPAAPDAGR